MLSTSTTTTSSTSTSTTKSTAAPTNKPNSKKKKKNDTQDNLNKSTNPLSLQEYLKASQIKSGFGQVDTIAKDDKKSLGKKKNNNAKLTKDTTSTTSVHTLTHGPTIQDQINQNKKLKNPKNKLFVVRDTPKTKKPSTLKRNILLYKETKEKLSLEQQDNQNVTTTNLTVDSSTITSTNTSTTSTNNEELDTANSNVQLNNMNDNLAILSLEDKKVNEQFTSLPPLSQSTQLNENNINNENTDSKDEEDQFLMEFKQEYINQVVNQEINDCAKAFINRIKMLQDNYTKNNPKKPKKRFITGLREIERDVDCDKISCVIFAPNIDDVGCEGGLNPLIQSIIRMCRKKQILYTFALSKRIIGRLLHVPVKISAFGVLSHDGAHDLYKHLESLTQKARTTFKENNNQILKEHGEEAQKQIQEHQSSVKEINQAVNKEIKSIKKKHQDTLKIHRQAREEKDKLEAEKKEKIKERKKQKAIQEQQQLLQQKKLEKQKQLEQMEQQQQPTTDSTKKKPSQQKPSKLLQQPDKMMKKIEASDQLLYNNNNEMSTTIGSNNHHHQKSKKK